MHICHVHNTACFSAGGVVRYIYDQGRGVAHRGHTVRFCTEPSQSTDLNQLQNMWGDEISLHMESTRKRAKLFLNAPLNPSTIDLVESASIIHCHGVWSLFNARIAHHAYTKGIPYIVTMHGMFDDWCMQQSSAKKKIFLKLKGWQYLQRAKLIVTSTQNERIQTSKRLPDARIEVLPPVLDLNKWKDLPNPGLADQHFLDDHNPEDPVVLFLSRIHAKKGAEILLRALNIYEKQRGTVSLIFAGVGEDRYTNELKDLIKELNLRSTIKFIGMVDGELKSSLYARADLFALPTAQENFGLVFTESFACGTPVLTTEGIDLCNELMESRGASLCERTPSAVADKLITLLSDKQKLKQMGEHGREWVMQKYNDEQIIDLHEKVYETCSSTPAHKPDQSAYQPIS